MTHKSRNMQQSKYIYVILRLSKYIILLCRRNILQIYNKQIILPHNGMTPSRHLKLSQFKQSKFVGIIIVVCKLLLSFPLDLNTYYFSFFATYFLVHNSQHVFSTPSCDQEACYVFSYLGIRWNSTLNNTQIIMLISHITVWIKKTTRCYFLYSLFLS